jgi:hypothetical protein
VDETMKTVDSMEQYPLLGKNVIDIQNLHTFPENSLEILTKLVEKFQIPTKYHFPLFCRIRLVKSFPNNESRTKLIHIRLLSFIILGNAPSHVTNIYFFVAQAALLQDAPWLTGFFRAEPDFLPETVGVLDTEKPIPSNIRATAVRALAAIATDQTRLPAVLSVTGCHLHHGVIPTILRRAVANIASNALPINIFSDFF